MGQRTAGSGTHDFLAGGDAVVELMREVTREYFAGPAARANGRTVPPRGDAQERRRFASALAALNVALERRVVEVVRERDLVWNASRDLLVVADRQGGSLRVNPAWTATLGWSASELLDGKWEGLEHPDDGTTIRSQLGAIAADGEPRRFENRLRHKDGSYRRLSWDAAPEPDCIFAVVRDVTAECAAAAALSATQEALRQAHKMEAVGQLATGIAHDFNNLLTVILGSIDLARVRSSQGRFEEIERHLAGATASANRAAGVVERLLALARRQPVEPKPVAAFGLVAGLADLLRRGIGEAIALEIVSADGLWLARCDPNELESALLNLAVNARDAMPAGGRLVIELANETLVGAAAARRGVAPGDYVCIRVTDTGTGMCPETARRAFDPFFTTKPADRGTGLGLFMIDQFARQSHGAAAIESAVGSGTTISLHLPRHRGRVVAEPVAPGPGGIPRAGAEATVLVVEDEAIVRAAMTESLTERGYRALEAHDGPSGLRILSSGESIDLLVADLGLPGMNGRDLVARAREGRPDLKVLFIAGRFAAPGNGAGFLGPGTQMIAKPFSLSEMVSRVHEMTSGRPAQTVRAP